VHDHRLPRHPEGKRPESTLAGPEVEHVLGTLERLQATFRWKADGLDSAQLAARLPSSTLTAGDLLREAIDGRVSEDPPSDWRP
jgi:hypothetical protein